MCLVISSHDFLHCYQNGRDIDFPTLRDSNRSHSNIWHLFGRCVNGRAKVCFLFLCVFFPFMCLILMFSHFSINTSVWCLSTYVSFNICVFICLIRECADGFIIHHFPSNTRFRCFCIRPTTFSFFSNQPPTHSYYHQMDDRNRHKQNCWSFSLFFLWLLSEYFDVCKLVNWKWW